MRAFILSTYYRSLKIKKYPQKCGQNLECFFIENTLKTDRTFSIL